MDASVAKQIADSFTRMVDYHNALFTETRLLHSLLRSHGLLTEIELKDDPQVMVPMGEPVNVPVATTPASRHFATHALTMAAEFAASPEVAEKYRSQAQEIGNGVPAVLNAIDAGRDDLAPPKDLVPAAVRFEDHRDPENVRHSPEYTLGDGTATTPTLDKILTDGVVFDGVDQEGGLGDDERLPKEEPEILLTDCEEEAEAELLNVLATVQEVNAVRKQPSTIRQLADKMLARSGSNPTPEDVNTNRPQAMSIEGEVAQILAQSKGPVSQNDMNHALRVIGAMKGMSVNASAGVLSQGIGPKELNSSAAFSIKPIVAEETVPEPKPAAEGDATLPPQTDIIGELFAEILRDHLDPSVMRHARGTVKNWSVYQEDLMRTPHRFIQKWPSGIYLNAADKSRQLLINILGDTQFVFSNIDKLIVPKGTIAEPVKEYSFVLASISGTDGRRKPFVVDASTPLSLLEGYQQHFGTLLRHCLESRKEVTG